MNRNSTRKSWDQERFTERIHTVEGLSVQYEGRTEEIATRLPDVSPSGMFVNTSQKFPEGAVLHLRFRLALSRAEIETRCEVRHCQPGIGVGVEFIGISPEATRAIEHELELWGRKQPGGTSTKARTKKTKRSER